MRSSILISLYIAVVTAQYVSTTQYVPATPSVVVPDEDAESNGSLVCDPNAAYSAEHPCGGVSNTISSAAAATSTVSSAAAVTTIVSSAAAVTDTAFSTTGTANAISSTAEVSDTAITTNSPASTTVNEDLSATATSPIAGYTLSDGGYVCNPAHSYPASQSCDTSGATPTLVYTYSSASSAAATSTSVALSGAVTSATPIYSSWQSLQTGTPTTIAVVTTSGGWYNYIPKTATPVAVYTGAAASSLELLSFGVQAAGIVGLLLGSWLV